MKKKLLVVGDSFMRPDARFPGQHWSEMLPDYDIDMRSKSGATNGIILHRFYTALKQNPDAVVFGFTESTRIEFPSPDNVDEWNNNPNIDILTADQKLTSKMYRIHVCEDMALFKSCAMIRSALMTCEQKCIPYAWSLNLLFANVSKLPFANDHVVKQLLGEFFHRLIPTNLATYTKFKDVPGFHVDDPEWQEKFAQEVQEILQKPIDFCVKI